MRLRIALLSILAVAVAGIVGVTSASGGIYVPPSVKYGDCTLTGRQPAYVYPTGYYNYNTASVDGVGTIYCTKQTTLSFYIYLLRVQAQGEQYITRYTKTIPAYSTRTFTGGRLTAQYYDYYASWIGVYQGGAGSLARSCVYQLQGNATWMHAAWVEPTGPGAICPHF